MFFVEVNSDIDGARHAFHRLPARLEEVRKDFTPARPKEELDKKLSYFKKRANEILKIIETFKREICDYEDFIFDEAERM